MVSIPPKDPIRHPHAVNGIVEFRLYNFDFNSLGRLCIMMHYLSNDIFMGEIQEQFKPKFWQMFSSSPAFSPLSVREKRALAWLKDWRSSDSPNNLLIHGSCGAENCQCNKRSQT